MRWINLVLGLWLLVVSAWAGVPSSVEAATPPFLPFNRTGDLYILDVGCDCILRVTPAGAVSVAVTQAAIEAAAGLNPGGFDLDDGGIAFDASGAMYFTLEDVASVLKLPRTGGLFQLAAPAALEALAGADVDPDGVAFGSDGFLYVQTDQEPEEVLRMSPTTGAATILIDDASLNAIAGITDIDLESGIVGVENGILYLVTETDPNAIVTINLAMGTGTIVATGAPFSDTDAYMTRAPNGDLIVADTDDDVLYRVTPGGVVSVFLSEASLETVAGADIGLSGGFAFDASGNFFVTDSTSDQVLRFDTSLVGTVFLTAGAIQAVTGSVPNLSAGVAFAPVQATSNVPTASAVGLWTLVTLLFATGTLFLWREGSNRSSSL